MVYDMNMNKKTITLLTSVGSCYIAAAIGSIGMLDSIQSWYHFLRKPFFTPPDYIFGPVWTILYTMMGYSLFLIRVQKNSKQNTSAQHWFALQLILNTLWSIVFFGLHLPGMAFILIIFLWISIYMTIREFNSLIPISGKILLPYLGWVTFAGVLNAAIVVLN